MRSIFGLVFIAGLALAGFAVYMVQNFVGQNQAALDQERNFRARLGPVTEVYVAKEPLPYGTALTKDNVVKVLLPKNNLPAGFYTAEAALFPGDYEKPRFVVRQMEKSEPILTAKVTEPGEDVGLTTRLTKGMRAFAIKVDVASGVSGFLRPGDRVDIYWTGTTRDFDGERTQLIEGTVEIIAVDQQSNSDSPHAALVARTVTVAASPQQVARLAQAQATGRLSLSLVGAGDSTAASSVEVDSRALLGIVIEEQAAAVEEKVCSIKTRKGGEVIEIPIACTN